jgi:hypothetical protein
MEGYNPRTMQRDFRVSKASGVTKDADTFNVIPLTILLQFGYVHNDPMKLLEFAARWACNVRGKAFNFGIKYHGVVMDIQVDVDTNLDIPEIDADVTQPTQGIAVGTMTLRGYVVEEVRKFEPITGVALSSITEDNTNVVENGVVLEFGMDGDEVVPVSESN